MHFFDRVQPAGLGSFSSSSVLAQLVFATWQSLKATEQKYRCPVGVTEHVGVKVPHYPFPFFKCLCFICIFPFFFKCLQMVKFEDPYPYTVYVTRIVKGFPINKSLIHGGRYGGAR